MTTPFSLRADRAYALPNPQLFAVALLLALVLPNPVGYVGGGGDDYYYVQAARCVAAHGWCVPETHWAARWPLVAPMGAVFALFGDGRWQAAIVPLSYSLIAVWLFVRLVDSAWGRSSALLSGIAFVATAAFAKCALQPNVETVELTWALVAVWAGRRAILGHGRPVLWAICAGVFLGLAIQTRMTSLAWLPILAIGLLLIPGPYRRLAIPGLAGVMIPTGLDMLVNWHIAGDALLNQHLSIVHTRIASSELADWVDHSRSPLFNPQFIGGWVPAVGIHTHWTIQGVINLVLNPQIGPVLVGAIMTLLLARTPVHRRSPELLMAGAALLYTGALIYALAIDPKARMFLPTAAIAAALIGRQGIQLWQSGKWMLVGVMLAGIVTIGVVQTAKRFEMGKSGPLAAQWAREHPGEVSVEETTRRLLTFDPIVRGLPVWPADTTRVLVLIAAECRDSPVAKVSGPLVRRAYFGRKDDPVYLCEFRARRDGPNSP